jgi:predicted RNA-binding protein with PIN domain
VPYLIDGNNVLGSWGGPHKGDDRRDEVVRRVAAFCRARGAQATVVFDGGPLRADRPRQELGPVSIRVPPSGQDADSVIRGLVDSAPAPRDLIVVSSDKALYSYVRTRGARVLRVHEWSALERQSPPASSATPGGAAVEKEKPEREHDVAGWLKTFGEK